MAKQLRWLALALVFFAGCSKTEAEPVIVCVECRLGESDPAKILKATEALEQAVATLDGLVSTQAMLWPDRFRLWIELRHPAEDAVRLVNKRLTIADLPEHQELLLSSHPDQAQVIALSYQDPAADDEEAVTRSRRLRIIVDDQLRPRLQRVPHVEEVTVAGGVREQFEVRIDPESLKPRNLDAEDVVSKLRSLAFEEDLSVERLAATRMRPRNANLDGPPTLLADVAVLVKRTEGPHPGELKQREGALDVCVAVQLGRKSSAADVSAEIDKILEELRTSTKLPRNVQVDRRPPAGQGSVQRLLAALNRERPPGLQWTLSPGTGFSQLKVQREADALIEVRGRDFQPVHRAAGQLAQALQVSDAIAQATTHPQRLPGEVDYKNSVVLLDRSHIVAVLGSQPYQTADENAGVVLYRQNRECVSYVTWTAAAGTEDRVSGVLRQTVAEVKNSLSDPSVRIVIPR